MCRPLLRVLGGVRGGPGGGLEEEESVKGFLNGIGSFEELKALKSALVRK